MASPERLVLVDGSALIFRAYFAIPANLATKTGLHTNAIYGFANMFRKLYAQKRPTYAAVVFDPPGGTFREAQYAEYKAQRPRMPDELAEQLPWIDEVVAANRFPVLRVQGYEADDVIGTLTERAVSAGHEVHIYSGDKDFAQLIGERVRMIDPMRDITYDAELVRKKWGVPPEQFVDLLALMGDSVDNIPGVPGVGQKTAASLLAEHGSLDGVLANLERLKGKTKALLTEHQAQAKLSRALATIDRQVPLPTTWDELRLPELDRGALDDLYRKLEFYSFLGDEVPAGPDTRAPVTLARTPDEIAAALAALGDAPAVVEHLRDDALPTRGLPLGVAIAGASGEPVWIPLTDEAQRRAIAPWLADPMRPKLAHGAKPLVVQLARAGLALRGLVADTQLASFLIEPTKLIPHELEHVTREYLQKLPPSPKGTLGKGATEKRWSEVTEEERARHATARAALVREVWPLLSAKLEEQGQTEQLVRHDLPLVDVLARMELAGILVDAPQLAALEADFTRDLEALERRIYALVGHPFNIGSTKQLGEVLFDELKLPVIKRNKTGYSTDAEVLERLAPKHEIAKLLLEHRKLGKLITTYTRVLVEAVDPSDQRIHATFQMTVGATGRIITTDPDLQRTPVRTPEGKRIRQCFVAPPGLRLMSADWSQIELRILAHVSGDPRLVAAFAQDADVHRETAARLFSVPPAEVTAEQRGVGKTVNFATIYGQGANALGQILGIAKKEAQAYIDGYFEAYAGVRAWLDRTIAEAERDGYVTTLLGRRRYIAELHSRNVMDHQTGQRIAANTPIQGSAADLCKLAMLEIDAAMRAAGLRARMLLQIHDELVFEVPEDEVAALEAIVRDKMSRAYPLSVPLVVDVGLGRTWAEAKE